MAIRVGVNILQFCSVSNSLSHIQPFQIKWEVYCFKEFFTRLYSLRQYVFCKNMCIFAYLLHMSIQHSLIGWNWQVFRRGFSRLIKVALQYMVNWPLKFLGLLYRDVSCWVNYKEWTFHLLHEKNPKWFTQYCCHQMECNTNIPRCLKAQTGFVLQYSFTVLAKVDDCCFQSNN